MANLPLWEILWVLAALVIGAVMFGAWTGPHRSVSNLSRWAMRMHIRPVPAWLSARAADRWAFRGGLAALILLLAVAWFIPSQAPNEAPAENTNSGVWPKPDSGPARPDRHIDADLQNAIRVHIPKTKQIKIVVLRGDAEADRFSWEIEAFLKAEGYTVLAPHMLFAMLAGEPNPVGTAIYPDEKDANVVVIRIGLNDRG